MGESDIRLASAVGTVAGMPVGRMLESAFPWS